MREGIAQGRFHLIHKGHVEYLLACKERCDFLYVGISDCDPQRSYFSRRHDEAVDRGPAPYRSLQDPIFPFTFYERMHMIRHTLAEEGISPAEFAVVPFPVHTPELLKYYVPTNAAMYVTIYDEWGERKTSLFAELGFTVEVLWRRSMAERFTTATEVRERMRSNQPWEHLVPTGVAHYLQQSGLCQVLQKL